MPQVIISPAKQMRVARDSFAPRGVPPFPERTREIHRALMDLWQEGGEGALQTLWKVSERLLAQNLERLRAFVPIMDTRELEEPDAASAASPAAFSYIGAQYRSMAPEVLDLDALAWLQGHLWIISALYGCARPFDAVEPYRLEMAAPLSVGGARDLYDYWGPAIARAVAGADVALVVNLASVEYARAVLPHLDADAQVVTCIFGEDLRGGRPVQRATASKVARGSMVRWMAEHQVEDADALERFDVGYRLEPELCLERRVRPADPGTPGARERVLVFMRHA